MRFLSVAGSPDTGQRAVTYEITYYKIKSRVSVRFKT